MDAKLNLDEKQEELSKTIELSCGFEELRTMLNDFEEEDKIWGGNQELIRKESVESQLSTIRESENDSGAAISGNGGDQSSPPEQQEANIENEM